jgi:hypothetical protein
MRGTIPGSIPIAVLDQAGRKVTRIEYLVLPGERRSRFASLPQECTRPTLVTTKCFNKRLATSFGVKSRVRNHSQRLLKEMLLWLGCITTLMPT